MSAPASPVTSFFARLARRGFLVSLALFLAACSDDLNDPYPASESGQAIFYAAFTDRPKHLDPARSYTENEYALITQIYRPPLQYHYLKRPYELIPDAATQVPHPKFYDAQGRLLPENAPAEQVAQSVYEIELRPDMRYQPHPAFAVDEKGQPLYLNLSASALADKYAIGDFSQTGSRAVTAADYAYQIKRLASPAVFSPIAGLMREKIVGFADLMQRLDAAHRAQPDAWLDLAQFDFPGVEIVDATHLRIHVIGRYPQFLYWLAMPFFAPMPREADRFFSQPGMEKKNLTLDWWPIGSGAFMMTENDPNRRMALERNPNFAGETYLCEGEPEDKENGLLNDCGKPLPLIEKAVFTREKESIPYWNKFLQGYYDISGIASDNFDQAVQTSVGGEIDVTPEMAAKGISLLSSVKPSIFYLGFNLRDPVVGGLTESGRKLRQALSIAIDEEEFISIFLNGRGLPGQGPLPPGFFGYESGKAGVNPFVYDWKDGKAVRKPIEEARRLLAEAGWPNGRNVKTGEPLILNLDTTAGGMGEKAQLDWLSRQFAKIDAQLVVRSTDFNRFQDKIKRGSAQIFFLGWNADYPDPENFFFLFYGKPGNLAAVGENKSNYQNPEFDYWFEKMKTMDNTPERLSIIHKMLFMTRRDAPWIYAFYPKAYTLTHAWLKNRKPNGVANNTLKYQRIDAVARENARARWNTPVMLPLFIFLGGLAMAAFGLFLLFHQREKRAGIKR
ncbi:MAG: ABC transporter substrate-binding protein [Zoogloeaceae bacterium]|jgi:ABC-type transport system substrate-binding protein|nr:ABC transporter substrate-binding protein [Zoogloeaceae bacterium]